MNKNELLTPEQIAKLKSMKEYWDEISRRPNPDDIAVSEIYSMMNVVNSPMAILKIIGQFITDEPQTQPSQSKPVENFRVKRVNEYNPEIANMPWAMGITPERGWEIQKRMKQALENHQTYDVLDLMESFCDIAETQNELIMISYLAGVNHGIGLVFANPAIGHAMWDEFIVTNQNEPKPDSNDAKTKFGNQCQNPHPFGGMMN